MNRPTIKLVEYRTKIPSVQSKYTSYLKSEVDVNLSKIELTEEDRQLLDGPLKDIIEIAELKDGLAISSQSYIGVANFTNFSLVVEPKILLKSENLFGMINYAYDVESWEMIPAFSPQLDKEFLIDIVIGTFVKKCEKLFKHGLFKSYVTHQNNITFLRGKLLLIQQIQNVLKNKPIFACEYDELEYDNLENQIILFCLRRSYVLTRNELLKKKLRLLTMQLSSVVSEKFITLNDFRKLHYNRQNSHYKSTLELCRLLLDSSGVSNFYSDKKHQIQSFFVDMNEIFEKFVAKLFDEFYSHKYKVESQKSIPAWNIDEQRTKSIRTDILLTDRRTNKKTVIDTKYKEAITDSDLYQLGFYIHEYRAKDEGSIMKCGYLILPTSNEDQKLDSQLRSRSEIRSMTQKILIVKSFINLDSCIELLYKKDSASRTELSKMIEDLIID